MSKNFLFSSITDVSKSIENGEISPTDLIDESLQRIVCFNEKINAFVTVLTERAREAAKKAEHEIKKGNYRGPLHGIPIGVKDIIDTQDVLTTYGSIIFKNNIPTADATVVTRLKNAGAIIIGKTNTHEFAIGATTNNPHYGPTRNPWNLELIPGGSSGGSAAATVSHMCFASLGSDTGGSIRIPAAFCGLVGLKPSYGRVSLDGVFPVATSFDHVGPLTRTVQDSAILLSHLAGFDEKDPRSLMSPVPDYTEILVDYGVEGMTIGIDEEVNSITLDPEIKKNFEFAVKKIESIGVGIIEVNSTPLEEVKNVSRIIISSEASLHHSSLLEKHSSLYGSDVRQRLNARKKITVDEYIEAVRKKEVIIREFEMLFKEVDFLLSPSVQIRPPIIGQETTKLDSEEINVLDGCTKFTRSANLTGMPALVIPFGFSSDSLPLSIQLMAPRLHETKLLKFASSIEKATPNLRNKTPRLN